MAKKLRTSPGTGVVAKASDSGSTPFSLVSEGSGQGSLLTLLAPPPKPTSPLPLSRREKFEQRVAAVIDRWNKAARKYLKKGDPKPLGGLTLTQKFKAIVSRCFDVNDSEAKCATELQQAQKEAVKNAKRWWKPRPKTCDDRIARKFAKCKTVEMW